MDRHSLAIIGAGPAGYTLAQELVKTNAFDTVSYTHLTLPTNSLV